MVSISKDVSGDGFRIVLSPNCSISWRELILFYLLTCVVAFAVGIFFTLQGLWLVLPFSGIEIAALGICLYLTSRKVYRREVITLYRDRTRVEKGLYQAEQSWEFETPWIRLRKENSGPFKARRKLVLGSHGKYVEVGGFLDDLEKDELAFKLKDCIIRGDF
jgi:uncharacterized membrane protein